MTLSPLLSKDVRTQAKGIFFIRLDGTVGIYDAVAAELLNFPAEEVLKHTYWDFFVDDFFGFSMHQAMLEKQIPPLTSISESPSAVAYSTLDFDITFLNLDPSMAGVLIIIRNIEALQRHNAIALRNIHMKELGKMAGLIVHEIRNPLGGIKGFSSILQRDLQDNADLHRMATNIVEGSENLNRLVNNVIAYTKPLHLPLESHNLVELLKELLSNLKADESIDQHIEMHLETVEDKILVLIDPEHLKSAFCRLTSNAIHAMPEGGKLTIRVKNSPTKVIIEISDTGCGISKENQEKIFSPFYSTKAENGHGFGLVEVYKIIHAHHGEIDFISEENVGTTFMVYLPEPDLKR